MLRILAFLLFTTFGLAPHPLAAEADILLHDGARYHPSVVSGAALGVAPPEGAGACRREPGWTRSAAPEMPRQLASGRVVGLTAVEADWRDVGRLYALGQESLYTTLDCGQNWRAIPSPSRWEPLAVGSDGSLYVGGPSRFITSRDSGQTWEQGAASASSIAVAPSAPERLYFVLSSVPSPRSAGLGRSDDGGRTWVQLTTSPGFWFGELAVDPSDPDIAYFGTPGGAILRSQDGGTSFQRFSTTRSHAGDRLTSLSMSPAGLLGFAAVGASLYGTQDGGQNWSLIARHPFNLPLIDLAVGPEDGTLLWAVTNNGELWSYQLGVAASVDSGVRLVSVLEPTPVFGPAGDLLYQAQVGDWYALWRQEEGWGLVVREADSPDAAVWLEIDERVQLGE